MNPVNKVILATAALLLGLTCAASAEPYDGTGPGQSTIGTGGDYASLHDACEAISASPLTGGNWDFLILNDLDEPLNSSITQTASTSHTITLRPAPGVDATVTFTTTQFQPPIRTVGHLTIGAKVVNDMETTLTYVATNNIVIDGSNILGGNTQNLTLKNISGDGARTLIGIMGHCDNIIIKNSRLYGYGIYDYNPNLLEPVFGIHFAHRNFGLGQHAPPAEVQNNGKIQNCDLRYFGTESVMAIEMNYASDRSSYPNVFSTKLTVVDNKLTSCVWGMALLGFQNLKVTRNTITVKPGIWHTRGIYIEPISRNSHVEISRNSIHIANATMSPRVAGIHTREMIFDCNTIIRNNIISGDFSRRHDYNGLAYAYGILSEAESGSTVTLYHNSISLTGYNCSKPVAGFYLGGIPGDELYTFGQAVLRNNVIRTEVEDSVAVQTQGTAATIDSDYNDLFATPDAYIGRCAGVNVINSHSLAWWQNATGQDTHSANVDPYASAGDGFGTWVGPADSDQADLHFTAYPGPAYLAPALASVTADIDNDPRPTDWAVMGADEMPHPPASVDEWALY